MTKLSDLIERWHAQPGGFHPELLVRWLVDNCGTVEVLRMLSSVLTSKLGEEAGLAPVPEPSELDLWLFLIPELRDLVNRTKKEDMEAWVRQKRRQYKKVKKGLLP